MKKAPIPKRNPVGKFGGYGGVDRKRPKIKNPDGSFSTEETVTVPIGDKWVNLPSIIEGKRPPKKVSAEEWAVKQYKKGKNKPTGVFKTLEEAVFWAKQRTDALGSILKKK